MERPLAHELYLESLKKLLRSRKITYDDLAEQIGLSVSGVKKLMTGKDISLRRLSEICQLLNISPGQLCSLAEEDHIQVIKLTPKQERALMSERQSFIVFWRFCVENLPKAEIKKREGLSEAQLTHLMERLTILGLIKKQGASYRSLMPSKFRIHPESDLARKLNAEWSQLVLARSLKSAEKRTELHRLITVSCPSEKFNDLLGELHETLDRFINRIQIDLALVNPSERTEYSLLLCGAEGSPLDGEIKTASPK